MPTLGQIQNNAYHPGFVPSSTKPHLPTPRDSTFSRPQASETFKVTFPLFSRFFTRCCFETGKLSLFTSFSKCYQTLNYQKVPNQLFSNILPLITNVVRITRNNFLSEFYRLLWNLKWTKPKITMEWLDPNFRKKNTQDHLPSCPTTLQPNEMM